MTDKADESALLRSEPAGAPPPTVPSGAPGDKPPSTPSGEPLDVIAQLTRLASEVQQLRADLPDVVEGQIKRTKDRRFRSLQGIDPDTLIAFKGYLDKFGGDFERAARELQIDLMLEGKAGPVPTPGSDGEGQAFATGAELAGISSGILTEAGLAFDDPAYLAFVQQNQGRRFKAEEWRSAVNSFAFKRIRQGSPAAGAIVGEQGLPPPPADLQREYDKELAALRGSRNIAGLMDLRKRYRARGLNV